LKHYPPYKIFLSFVLVYVCAILLFFIIPGEKYRIQELIPGGIRDGKNSTSAKKSRPPEISGAILHPSDDLPSTEDSLLSSYSANYPNFVSLVDIEYPSGDSAILLPFVESLRGISGNGGQSRIFYYGDSQLEGDRISAFFREHLQGEYGGSGPGMISLAEPVYSSLSLVYQQSTNWMKVDQLVDQQASRIQGLGTMLSYSQYDGNTADLSVSLREGPPNPNTYFDCFRLFLFPAKQEGIVRFTSSDTLSKEWKVPPGRELIEISHKTSSNQRKIRLDFDNMDEALMMGLSLESSVGVQVDNIAHRGSAGLEFSSDRSGSFKKMAFFLNPDLVILQFGINVVPAKSNDFEYYGTYLKKEVQFIQEQIPGVPILIVGVSDMGHLVDGIPSSYLSVEKVRDVQRSVASQTGAAFFDLLSFMGGSGSFKMWMEADPVLMRQDFTHFSHTGGALVAEGLARALSRAVSNYPNHEGNGL